MKNEQLPVVIVGAGPIGLAAAAHLVQRNIPFLLFEAGGRVGDNMLSWGHVRVFSPWRYNLDTVAKRLLLEHGWTAPDDEKLPTGGEIVEQYLEPLAHHPAIVPFLHISTKVLSVGRWGIDKTKSKEREKQPFAVRVVERGVPKVYKARAVLDATGTWGQPNPLGANGMYAEGELDAANTIFYGIPDVRGVHRERYKNASVLVVGSGHSAMNVVLDIAAMQEEYPRTQLHWVLRKADVSAVYGGGENDALEARGALGMRIEQLVTAGRLTIHTPFHIMAVSQRGNGMDIVGEMRGASASIEQIQEIVCVTGARPDMSFLSEVRVDMDAALESVYDLAELIDPNVHSCGTVRPHGERELRQPDKDFYIVGAKSYGRAPTFLMATGYEQVRSVVAYLDGDYEAAERVELDLPETGVCSSTAGGECCSLPTPEKQSEPQCCESPVGQEPAACC